MTRVSQVALGADLMQRARELGFCDVGFCSVLPFEDWKRVAYEPVRSNFGHDPAELLPGAQAIVVAVRQYTAFGPWPEGSAALANYYVKSNVGFVETKELAAVLEQAGYSALANAKLPAKQAALRAGLGFQGKNTQFCHDEYGMLVSLHLILTDAPLAGEDRARRECPNCGMCAAACPTGAIRDEGFDHSRCLRFLMNSAEPVPMWARALMGNRLLGCTDCQHACPHAVITEEAVPESLARASEISALLRGDKERLELLAAAVGSNFTRPKGIRMQAVLCAGNSGDRAYVPELVSLLAGGEAPLRIHAAWALGRLGGEEARLALQAALPREEDGAAREEITAALKALI